MATNFIRTNNFSVVGTLKNASVKEGQLKSNGQNYIDVTATIESVIGGVTKTFEVRLFSGATTAEGKPNAFYDSYSKLPELTGKKISLNGEIRENRFWSANLNQMISKQELAGKFVNGVSDSTVDEAIFDIGGFVVSPLTAKENKAKEVYRYDIGIGQSNFNGNSMSVINLHVNPADRELIKALNDIEVGTTVKLMGDLDFVSKEVVKTEEVGFGKPVTKTFTNVQKNYFITGGSVVEDEDIRYDSLTIKELIAAYKERDVQLQSGAKTKSASAPAETQTKITSRQTSLI